MYLAGPDALGWPWSQGRQRQQRRRRRRQRQLLPLLPRCPRAFPRWLPLPHSRVMLEWPVLLALSHITYHLCALTQICCAIWTLHCRRRPLCLACFRQHQLSAHRTCMRMMTRILTTTTMTMTMTTTTAAAAAVQLPPLTKMESQAPRAILRSSPILGLRLMACFPNPLPRTWPCLRIPCFRRHPYPTAHGQPCRQVQGLPAQSASTKRILGQPMHDDPHRYHRGSL